MEVMVIRETRMNKPFIMKIGDKYINFFEVLECYNSYLAKENENVGLIRCFNSRTTSVSQSNLRTIKYYWGKRLCLFTSCTTSTAIPDKVVNSGAYKKWLQMDKNRLCACVLSDCELWIRKPDPPHRKTDSSSHIDPVTAAYFLHKIHNTMDMSMKTQIRYEYEAIDSSSGMSMTRLSLQCLYMGLPLDHVLRTLQLEKLHANITYSKPENDTEWIALKLAAHHYGLDWAELSTHMRNGTGRELYQGNKNVRLMALRLWKYIEGDKWTDLLGAFDIRDAEEMDQFEGNRYLRLMALYAHAQHLDVDWDSLVHRMGLGDVTTYIGSPWNTTCDSYPSGRSLVVLINNFSQERAGNQVDIESLVNFFGGTLHYDVRSYNDCSRSHINDIFASCQGDIRRAAQENKRYLQLFIFILSHGDQDGIKTCEADGITPDGNRITAREIAHFFNGEALPELAGCPKMIFISCCRGSDFQPMVMVKPDIEAVAPSVEEKVIPIDADILIFHTTTPGYLSWRNVESGTHVIQILLSVIKSYYKKYDLDDLLRMVRKKVAEEMYLVRDAGSGGNQIPGLRMCVQMPEVTTTLRQAVILKPYRANTLT